MSKAVTARKSTRTAFSLLLLSSLVKIESESTIEKKVDKGPIVHHLIRGIHKTNAYIQSHSIQFCLKCIESNILRYTHYVISL